MSIITRIDNQTGTEITINYEIIGKDKPAMVFHHGNGNRIEDWHTLGYVTALKEDFQLVLIDSRGYGHSSKPHSPNEYSLKSRADDTIAVLDKEAIGTACCFGGSVGAAMCLLLAKFYPNHFNSYIFATPYFTLFSEELKKSLTQGVDAFLSKLEEMIGNSFTNLAVKETMLANDAAALWAANSSEWFDYRDFISYINAPSLIYAGEKESSIPELTDFCKKINASSDFKSELHIFPDMDHADVYWSGKTVAPVIKNFYNKVRQTQA